MRARGLKVDGNGRTGRLLLNWQLFQAGFPLTVIQVEERARYLGALDQGHTPSLPQIMGGWISASTVIRPRGGGKATRVFW